MTSMMCLHFMAVVNAAVPLVCPFTNKLGISVSEIGFNDIPKKFVNQVSNSY